MVTATSNGSNKFTIFVDDDPVGRPTTNFLQDVANLGSGHYVKVVNEKGEICYQASPGASIKVR